MKLAVILTSIAVALPSTLAATIVQKTDCVTGPVAGTRCLTECGVDHPGGDFAKAHVSSYQDCFNACSQSTKCTDAQYNSGDGYCYLKDDLKGARAYSAVTSVICSANPLCVNGPISGTTCSVQCATEYAGGDYSQLPVSSLQDCITACSKDATCTDAQYHSDNGYCYLKNKLTSATYNPHVDSVICGPRPPTCIASGKSCSVDDSRDPHAAGCCDGTLCRVAYGSSDGICYSCATSDMYCRTDADCCGSYTCYFHSFCA